MRNGLIEKYLKKLNIDMSLFEMNMTKQKRISITYMYSLAFFTCDCGKEVVSHTLNNSLYKGDCVCGLNWEIKNGMIKSSVLN